MENHELKLKKAMLQFELMQVAESFHKGELKNNESITALSSFGIPNIKFVGDETMEPKSLVISVDFGVNGNCVMSTNKFTKKIYDMAAKNEIPSNKFITVKVS